MLIQVITSVVIAPGKSSVDVYLKSWPHKQHSRKGPASCVEKRFLCRYACIAHEATPASRRTRIPPRSLCKMAFGQMPARIKERWLAKRSARRARECTLFYARPPKTKSIWQWLSTASPPRVNARIIKLWINALPLGFYTPRLTTVASIFEILRQISPARHVKFMQALGDLTSCHTKMVRTLR